MTAAQLTLGILSVATGKGELTVELRLLKKLYQDHCRYVDMITLD